MVIIEAAGAGFSAGADLLEDLPEDFDAGREIEERIKPTFMAIMNAPKPYIAAVNGGAVGVGCGLAMACDLTLMASDGFFLFAFAGLGLAPDGGTSWHLVRQIGRKRAFDILTGGQRITAQECHALGLVNAVVAPDELSKAARERARNLADKPWRGVAFAKQAVGQAALLSVGDLMSLEARLQSEAFASEEFRAAAQAFRSARP
ncbi:2-(1,2-epoxy-1,2-dihydrophenyl)acetyl-CoA isomerase [Sphingobium subterraneum]|uniref:2-(1,2-epoxy-1,2-dihydrophenyl)acetyl-CoA isomerase n=1 Tax=Sphingobium subterraneum TaxID=627688 RepID=A0A841J2W0_9SPHN|nr:2-(1,2-epoxy-1,2-dihydrophenyl)acetyl-CoA isomerase [Sphingobium subterraneum]